MKLAVGSVSGNNPKIIDGGDIVTMQNVTAVGGATNAPSATIPLNTYETIAICKGDASDYGVNLGGAAAVLGQTVEIYAEGNDITVYTNGIPGGVLPLIPFLSGAFSVVVPSGSGVKFKYVQRSDGQTFWSFLA